MTPKVISDPENEECPLVYPLFKVSHILSLHVFACYFKMIMFITGTFVSRIVLIVLK